MSKFGLEKRTIHDRAAEEQVNHRHIPGKAYEVAGPVTKLIHTIGGGFFNEPKYYDTNRNNAEFMAELLRTGKISSVITDEQGLTEQAREVLETAVAVAGGETPEDLLIVAAWARDTANGLKLRSTPQILLAVAAAHPNTRAFVPRYAPSIIQRADEIRQVFGAFRHLFMTSAEGQKDERKESGTPAHSHCGSLPHGLRKALAYSLATQSDYALLKYNGSDRPTFADVIKMVGGSRKIGKYLEKATGQTRANWPVSKAMFEYLVNGTYVEDLPPILRARRDFFGLSDPSTVTSELVTSAGLTWENIISHLGSTKQVWELCIPLMGEMALTRNLRNFEQAGISQHAWDVVYEKFSSIEESVQLPIRFFSAEREVVSTEAKSLLGRLLDRAVEKLDDLPGVTLVLTDNSGSAVGCGVSGKSKLRVSDAGNMLEAILAKKLGRRAIIGVFGDSLIWVKFNQNDSCVAIKNQIDSIAQREERSHHNALAIPKYQSGQGVGESTETGLWFGMDDITRRNLSVDRIIFLSDLCCYTQGDDGTAINCGINLEQYFGKKATIQSMVDKYRQTVNPKCFVYSINLNGHGQSQLRPDDERTYLLSGWSEKLINLIRALETGAAHGESTEPVEVPAIDILRSRYGKHRA